MTNVPTSRQTRPPGLAITSAQRAPGGCLRGSGAGKELFNATFRTDQRSGGCRISFRAVLLGAPAPSPSPRVGSPRSALRFPSAQSRGRARIFPSCKALPAAPWKECLSKAFFGSSANYFNTWDDISPRLSARGLFPPPFSLFPGFLLNKQRSQQLPFQSGHQSSFVRGDHVRISSCLSPWRCWLRTDLCLTLPRSGPPPRPAELRVWPGRFGAQGRRNPSFEPCKPSGGSERAGSGPGKVAQGTVLIIKQGAFS